MQIFLGGFQRFDEDSGIKKEPSAKVVAVKTKDQSRFPLLTFEDSNGTSPAHSSTRWNSIGNHEFDDRQWSVKLNSRHSSSPPPQLRSTSHVESGSLEKNTVPASRQIPKPSSNKESSVNIPSDVQHDGFSLPEVSIDDGNWVTFQSSQDGINQNEDFGDAAEGIYADWPYNDTTEKTLLSSRKNSTRRLLGNNRDVGKVQKETTMNAEKPNTKGDDGAPGKNMMKKTHNIEYPGLEEQQTLSTAPTSSQDWYGGTLSCESSTSWNWSGDGESNTEPQEATSSNNSYCQEQRNNCISPLPASTSQLSSVNENDGNEKDTFDMSVSETVGPPHVIVRRSGCGPGASVTSELTFDHTIKATKKSKNLTKGSNEALISSFSGIANPSTDISGPQEVDADKLSAENDTRNGFQRGHNAEYTEIKRKKSLSEAPNESNESLEKSNSNMDEKVCHKGDGHLKEKGNSDYRDSLLMQRFMKMAEPIIKEGAISLDQEETIRETAARLGISLEVDKKSLITESPPKSKELNPTRDKKGAAVGDVVSSKLLQAAKRKRKVSRGVLDPEFLVDSSLETSVTQEKRQNESDSITPAHPDIVKSDREMNREAVAHELKREASEDREVSSNRLPLNYVMSSPDTHVVGVSKGVPYSDTSTHQISTNDDTQSEESTDVEQSQEDDMGIDLVVTTSEVTKVDGGRKSNAYKTEGKNDFQNQSNDPAVDLVSSAEVIELYKKDNGTCHGQSYQQKNPGTATTKEDSNCNLSESEAEDLKSSAEVEMINFEQSQQDSSKLMHQQQAKDEPGSSSLSAFKQEDITSGWEATFEVAFPQIDASQGSERITDAQEINFWYFGENEDNFQLTFNAYSEVEVKQLETLKEVNANVDAQKSSQVNPGSISRHIERLKPDNPSTKQADDYGSRKKPNLVPVPEMGIAPPQTQRQSSTSKELPSISGQPYQPKTSQPDLKLQVEPRETIVATVTMPSVASVQSVASIDEHAESSSDEQLESVINLQQTTSSDATFLNIELSIPVYKEKPIGSSLEEIDLLNRFLKVAGPNFNGMDLTIIERERIHDDALRSGIPENFLNTILDQSAGILRWEDRSVVSNSSLTTERSFWGSRRRSKHANTPGGSSVRTRNTATTSSTFSWRSRGTGLYSSGMDNPSSLSVTTRDYSNCEASQASVPGGWTCMFNLQKHFWSDLQSQVVNTVGVAIVGESESVHSDDISWETGLKSTKRFGL